MAATRRKLAVTAAILSIALGAVVISPSVFAAGDATKGEAKMKEELEKLQGTWSIVELEIEGAKLKDGTTKGATITLKGESFITRGMGAEYKGTFKIDPTKTPKTMDMTFTDGPEKGNTSYAIYELDGDTWKLCLSLAGKNRPTAFATTAKSGFALETLKRGAAEKPTDGPAKDGSGKAQEKGSPPKESGAKVSDADKKELALLEGEWSMVSGQTNGSALPDAFVKNGKRVVKGNQTTVSISGQVMMNSTFTVDSAKKPKTIDFTFLEGPNKGKVQYGIYELDGDNFRSCFAPPGKDRPTEFATKAGDERTFSVWKRVKK